MPEKRILESETRTSNDMFTVKRMRKQVSYDDISEPVPVVSSVTNDDVDYKLGNELAEAESPPRANHFKNTAKAKQQNARHQYNQQPRVDPVYGQRSAFPGLEDGSFDGLLYGPPEDGLEYLRFVRSEANSLPSLFVASRQKTTLPESSEAKDLSKQPETTAESQRTETQDGDQASTGYMLIDGVVIATSTTDGAMEIEKEEKKDSQSSYYNLLKSRFLLLRSTLRCPPPAAIISGLDDNHPVTLPIHIKAARTAWTHLLGTVEPQMAQLACMDMASVLGALRLLGDLLGSSIKENDAHRIRRIGAWAWGLLGRCREVGELGSEEVGELRIFGRKALALLKKLEKTADHAIQSPVEADSDLGEENFSDDEQVTFTANSVELADMQDTEDLETAKRRLQNHLFGKVELADEEDEVELHQRRRRNTSSPLETSSDEIETTPAQENHTDINNTSHDTISDEPLSTVTVPAEQQSRILLNMIVTIVGEFYGQKDLLNERDIWH